MIFRVGIDLDDTYVPWYEPTHQLMVRAGVTNGVTPTTWSPHLEYGIARELWLEIISQATDAGELYTHDPYPDAVEAVRQLDEAGHEIHLVTARGTGDWPDGPGLQKLTIEWLYEHDVPHESLTFSHDKALTAVVLGLDYFIDDNVKHFESLHYDIQGCQAYLLDRPHNQHFEAPPGRRVYTMREFAGIILDD